jgi:hypothetical protein
LANETIYAWAGRTLYKYKVIKQSAY